VESALYVVSTPIGNLGDLTQRARETLAAVDLVAAEDTRRTGQLLAHLAIERPLLAYHDHSDERVAERIVERICAGGSVALVCDAGTPTISDPGYRLVRAVQDAGGRVVPIPGASALLAALSAAGLPSDRFAFEGFLAARSAARRRQIEGFAAAPQTRVLYEAPHRLLETLDDLLAILGPRREVALARELTKRFETVHRAPLATLRDWVAADDNQQRGECVLLIAPPPAQEAMVDEALGRLLLAMAQHMPGKQAAALLAQYSGVRRKLLYDYLLERRDDG
jgi:16S rRNA (cytidine1402-2'-O)-methyltransferase